MSGETLHQRGEPSLARKATGTGIEIVGGAEAIIGAAELNPLLALTGLFVFAVGSWVKNYGK